MPFPFDKKGDDTDEKPKGKKKPVFMKKKTTHEGGGKMVECPECGCEFNAATGKY